MLAMGSLDIYLDGRSLGIDSPFSPEAVAERFEIIAPMLSVFGGLAVLSGIAVVVCGKSAPQKKPSAKSCENMGETAKGKKTAGRGILLLAAIVFILLGVMNGGARDVLYKAIAICTECIGLG